MFICSCGNVIGNGYYSLFLYSSFQPSSQNILLKSMTVTTIPILGRHGSQHDLLYGWEAWSAGGLGEQAAGLYLHLLCSVFPWPKCVELFCGFISQYA
jgi:hypothetical protein